MWNSITPVRLRNWGDLGFNLCFIRVVAIKKWYGRYYWVCFSNNKDAIVKYTTKF